MTVDRQKILEAARHLRLGGIVVFPTETSYGIGCDARNIQAVKEIYRIKGREKKPLAVIAASELMVEKFFDLPKPVLELTKSHWPGPLTLILKSRDRKLSKALGITMVGVRVSPHPVPTALSKNLGAPIVATSANKSGKGNCYTLASVKRSLGKQTRLLYIDGGNLLRRKSSTVIGFKNKKIIIFRQGSIKI